MGKIIDELRDCFESDDDFDVESIYAEDNAGNVDLNERKEEIKEILKNNINAKNAKWADEKMKISFELGEEVVPVKEEIKIISETKIKVEEPKIEIKKDNKMFDDFDMDDDLVPVVKKESKKDILDDDLPFDIPQDQLEKQKLKEKSKEEVLNDLDAKFTKEKLSTNPSVKESQDYINAKYPPKEDVVRKFSNENLEVMASQVNGKVVDNTIVAEVIVEDKNINKITSESQFSKASDDAYNNYLINPNKHMWSLVSPTSSFNDFYKTKTSVINKFLIGGEVPFNAWSDELIKARVDLTHLVYDLDELSETMQIVQQHQYRVIEIKQRVNSQYKFAKRSLELLTGKLALIAYEKPAEKFHGIIFDHLYDIEEYVEKLGSIWENADAVSKNLDKAADVISRRVTMSMNEMAAMGKDRYEKKKKVLIDGMPEPIAEMINDKNNTQKYYDKTLNDLNKASMEAITKEEDNKVFSEMLKNVEKSKEEINIGKTEIFVDDSELEDFDGLGDEPSKSKPVTKKKVAPGGWGNIATTKKK